MEISIQPQARSWASRRLVATACILTLGTIIAAPETVRIHPLGMTCAPTLEAEHQVT